VTSFHHDPSRTGPFDPLILRDTGLPDKYLERVNRITAVGKINANDYVRLVVDAVFDPGLMGAPDFLVKGESVLRQKSDDFSICPVVKSPGHALQNKSGRIMEIDAETCRRRQVFTSACQ